MPNAAVLGRNLRPASLQGAQLESHGTGRGSIMCPMFPRISVSNRGQLKWHLMCHAEMSSEGKGNGAASVSILMPGRLKTTKVKFLLQRECMFGEQYKVIGGDPILGEWDPNAAVPLEWSEGHNWTAELEVPHGKQYKYKFLLFCKSGEIQWQPGPNRMFSTSQKPSSLVVSQPWDFDETCPDSEVGHTEPVIVEDAPSEMEETEKGQRLLEPKNFEPQNIDPEAKSDDSTRASEEVASVSNAEEESLVAEDHSDVSISGGHDADFSEVAVSNIEEEILVVENHSDVCISEVAVSNIEEEISVAENGAHDADSSEVKIEEESLVAEDHLDVCISGGQDAGSIEAVEPLKTETLLGSADVVQDTNEVQTFENDVNDVSRTVWRKDRAWVHKVLSALSALFRR